MFWNLLTGDGSSSGGCGGSGTIIMVVVMVALIAVYIFFSRRMQKKQQEQINATLDAIQPGNKVKTIGGICGVVVEVCPEDNTFILETGSEQSGKSYIKFDRKAVYQTDAVPAVAEAPVEENAQASAEAPFEEAQEGSAKEVSEAPVEEEAAEAPVEEEAAEEEAKEE